VNTLSRYRPFKTVGNCFQTWMSSAFALLFIGFVGWIAPAAGREQALPILETILMEDRSSDTANYWIAAAREWRQVRIKREGILLDAAPDMPLRKGDLIRTGPNVAVAIRFPNGTQLYVRSDSRIRIGSIFAFVGELFVRVRGAFQVDTEFVTAGAEGTEWVMAISPRGDTRCTVLEGRVRMASRENVWRSLSITANRTYITRGWRHTEMMPASPEELSEMRRWIDQIDRLIGSQPAQTPEDIGPPPFHTRIDVHRHHDRDWGGERPTRPERNPGGERPTRPERNPGRERPTRPERNPGGERPTQPALDRRPYSSGDGTTRSP